MRLVTFSVPTPLGPIERLRALHQERVIEGIGILRSRVVKS